jgi:hypothetical protein
VTSTPCLYSVCGHVQPTSPTGLGPFAPPLGVGYYAACVIGRVHPDKRIRPILAYLLALLVGTILLAAIPVAFGLRGASGARHLQPASTLTGGRLRTLNLAIEDNLCQIRNCRNRVTREHQDFHSQIQVPL